MAITKVFEDDFTESSNTLITSHTPTTLGLAWLALSQNGGANAIIDAAEDSLNQPFYSPSPQSDYIISVTESQSDDQECEHTLGSGVLTRILLQGQDGSTANDGYRLSVVAASITLLRVDEGVETQLDLVPGLSLVDTDRVNGKISASGDISVDVNDVAQTWQSSGTSIVNDTTHTGGWPGWTGRKSYTTGGITKLEASIDTAVGIISVTTGTAVPTQTEVDVVAGGKTIILTLTNDTFVAAGTGPIGSTADTQAIIDGLTSAQSETFGWNNEVRDKELTTAVVRTSSTVCTITLTASASYNITATETITATVPAAVLVTSATPVVSSPTFTVTHIVTIPSITTDPLKNNTGQLLTSESGVTADVYNTSTGALVVHKTGLTSDGTTAIVTFSDALMSATTEYRVVIELSGGEEGVARITTA